MEKARVWNSQVSEENGHPPNSKQGLPLSKSAWLSLSAARVSNDSKLFERDANCLVSIEKRVNPKFGKFCPKLSLKIWPCHRAPLNSRNEQMAIFLQVLSDFRPMISSQRPRSNSDRLFLGGEIVFRCGHDPYFARQPRKHDAGIPYPPLRDGQHHSVPCPAHRA
jgi:hypothetical protein